MGVLLSCSPSGRYGYVKSRTKSTNRKVWPRTDALGSFLAFEEQLSSIQPLSASQQETSVKAKEKQFEQVAVELLLSSHFRSALLLARTKADEILKATRSYVQRMKRSSRWWKC